MQDATIASLQATIQEMREELAIAKEHKIDNGNVKEGEEEEEDDIDNYVELGWPQDVQNGAFGEGLEDKGKVSLFSNHSEWFSLSYTVFHLHSQLIVLTFPQVPLPPLWAQLISAVKSLFFVNGPNNLDLAEREKAVSALKSVVCADRPLTTKAFGTLCDNDVRNIFEGKPTRAMQFKIEDFELGVLLGEGGFGTVYQALHKASNSIVALKLLRNDEYKEGNRHWLVHEIIFQHRVCHEIILQAHNVFGDGKFVYIILEYAPGGSVHNLLERKEVLSEKTAAQYISDLSKAIHHCHINRVANRDIKPDNFLLGFDGRSMIADFGCSADILKRQTTFVGTRGYIAPEVVMQGCTHDEKVDVWSLGICLVVFLTGDVPHWGNGMDIGTIKWLENLPVSDDAKDLISKMLKYNRHNRISLTEIPEHLFVLRALGLHVQEKV